MTIKFDFNDTLQVCLPPHLPPPHVPRPSSLFEPRGEGSRPGCSCGSRGQGEALEPQSEAVSVPTPLEPIGPKLHSASKLPHWFPVVWLDPQNSPIRGQTRITWRGSDAQAACEVVFESSENGRHVRLHLVQVDNVPHQSRADADLGRLALGLGCRDQKEGRKMRFKQRSVHRLGAEAKKSVLLLTDL